MDISTDSCDKGASASSLLHACEISSRASVLLAASAALLSVAISNSARSDELIQGLSAMLDSLFSVSDPLGAQSSTECSDRYREAAHATRAVARTLSSLALDIKDSVGINSAFRERPEHVGKLTLLKIRTEIGQMLDEISYFDDQGLEAEFDIIKNAMAKLHAVAERNFAVGHESSLASDILVGKAMRLQRMIEQAISQ